MVNDNNLKISFLVNESKILVAFKIKNAKIPIPKLILSTQIFSGIKRQELAKSLPRKTS